jgi:hypothetical protein
MNYLAPMAAQCMSHLAHNPIVRGWIGGCGKSRRLPIHSILLHQLSEHRSRVKNEDDWVFASFDNNGKVVPMAGVKGSFGRILKGAGTTNFRFHDLRQHADSPILPTAPWWFSWPLRLALCSALCQQSEFGIIRLSSPNWL